LVLLIILANLFWMSSRYVTGSTGQCERMENDIVQSIKADQVMSDIGHSKSRTLCNVDKSPPVNSKEIQSEGLPVRIASSQSTAGLSRPSLEGISHVGGYDAAQLKRYSEYVNAISGRSIEAEVIISEPIRPSKLLKLMGISYVLTAAGKAPYPGSKKVFETGQADLFQLDNIYPRAFLVHKARVIPDKKKRLETLKTIDPLKEVILEKPLKKPPKPLLKAAQETVRIKKYSAHDVEMLIDASSDALLVFTDAYYPFWKAVMDEEPAEILPADHLFRVVWIPAGKHQLTFTYENSAYRIGRIITCLTVGVLILIFLSGPCLRRINKMWMRTESS